MRAPARLITLNLGSQTIGLAEFRVAHGGLTLVNHRLREMPIPVPETQSTFHPQHNQTLCVAAMCARNPDRSPVVINR